MAPRVTVLVPAYNAAPFLAEALACLAVQSYQDFEVLLVDDGSTDTTVAVAEQFRARLPALRIVRNSRNLGLIATLNRGLALATGEFIARMDADDLCPPERLAVQVAWLETHPDVVLLGANGELFGDTTGHQRFPTQHAALCLRLLFDNAFSHTAVVWRRAWLEDHALTYRPEARYAEDYDLWVRIVEAGGKVANLPQSLYGYRIHGASVTQSRREAQESTAGDIRRRQLTRLGCRFTADEVVTMDTYQFHGPRLPRGTDLACLRRIARQVAAAPLPGTTFAAAFERGRFLVSCLPRPRRRWHLPILALALWRIDAKAAGAFVLGYLAGRA